MVGGGGAGRWENGRECGEGVVGRLFVCVFVCVRACMRAYVCVCCVCEKERKKCPSVGPSVRQ